MRSNSLKYVVGFGVATLMAWSTPACSSDEDQAGGGKGGTGGGTGGAAGGTGGSATGGKGGTGATGGGGDGAPATKTCGTNTCTGVSVLGAVELPACCDEVDDTKCGLDLTIAQAFVPDLPSGCTELHQPGNPSSECPDLALDFMGTALDFLACCRPNRLCGALANISQVPGLEFGCVDPQQFLADAGTPGPCDPAGTGTGGSAGAPGTGGSAGADAATD